VPRGMAALRPTPAAQLAGDRPTRLRLPRALAAVTGALAAVAGGLDRGDRERTHGSLCLRGVVAGEVTIGAAALHARECMPGAGPERESAADRRRGVAALSPRWRPAPRPAPRRGHR